MKKISLFSCALAALMLGACSNEAGVTDGDQGIEWNENGKGFVSLAIQLPTQPSTRANDNYDDGTPAEYEVKNATLILFVNDVVNSAYGMNLNFSPEGTDNVTTTAKITQEINRISGNDPNIKALVVLNHNGVLAVENGVLKVGETDVTGKNLAELNDAVKVAIGTNYSWHTAGWLMSNAIMSDAPGGLAQPSGAKVVGPLTEIDADKIKKTKGEADASPAAVIYVERAEAKVTVKGSSSGTVTNGSDLKYTLEGWALDNTNKTNKLVRDVTDFGRWKLYSSSKLATGTSDYRFIGNTSITSAPSASMYRVYWGDDYNYSGTLTETGLTTVGDTAATLPTVKPADGTTADYCFENTTNLANMTEENLTRVIVKAKFNNGTSFYTVDGDRSAIWAEANVKKEAAARLLLDVTFNNWAKNNVKSGETLSSETDFYVTFTDEAAGKRTIETIVLNATGLAKLNDGAAASYPANAATLANNHIKLEYYANGMSYYPVYVKHFGDEQTPWTEDDQTGNTVYGDNPGDYLGRYGMLRNNWYDITVNSVKSLGDPNVVEVTDKPVDKKDAYISVKINVLSWAKRSQSVDL